MQATIGFLVLAIVAAYTLWLATRFVIAIENIAIIMAKGTDLDLFHALIGRRAK
jgi:hypothetical protein